MSLRRLVIHAPTVHLGGGKVLLLGLIAEKSSEISIDLTVSSRMELPEALRHGLSVTFVSASPISRVKSEFNLRKKSGPRDVVLCFASLPPLFRLRSKTWVFVQNRFMVDYVKLEGIGWKRKVRISMERFWLRAFAKNADSFIVQTPTMARLLAKTVGIPRERIQVIGYLPEENRSGAPSQIKAEYDFVYVSTGEPHKNHGTLFDAWELLAEQGDYPSLILTLDPQVYAANCERIRQMQSRGLKVFNLGWAKSEKIEDLYRRANALIYPSDFESFGLPLLEARRAGIAVLAPELDYVRDVVQPDQSFDPHSALSISRAVMRQLGKVGKSADDRALARPRDFLRALFI